MNIPPHALAALDALRVDNPGFTRLRALADPDLHKLLAFADPAQLTLTLGHVCGDELPPWVRERIAANSRTYSVRFARLKSSLLEIADALDRRGIEFAVLKGIAHSPAFTPDPLLRQQGDLDIWCRPQAIHEAQAALRSLGYGEFSAGNGRHLPPMVRDSQWKWRGDFFAADLPISVELHHTLWDGSAEFLRAPREDAIWERRVSLPVDGRLLPVLALPDTLTFAALHLMMHVLHGDLRVQRAWEIASFLHAHAADEPFWSRWRRSQPGEPRTIEAIIFALVSCWFGASLASEAADEIAALPPEVRLWIERHAMSPVEGLFRPNKDEIWLHLALLDSPRDKAAVFIRRALPLHASARAGWTRRLPVLLPRFLHHARTLVPALWGGARFWAARRELSGGFARYLVASVFFGLGAMIFLLLYNLYLLKLGFRENFLGQVAGAMSLGTVVGALPAAALTRRAGLRNTLLAAVSGSVLAALLRVGSVNPLWLLATAAASGVAFSLWTVSFSPVIAALTGERNRPLAFSLACATGISGAALAGLVGGRLPGLFGGPTAESLRAALLFSAGITCLAALPVAGLRLPPPPATEPRAWPQARALFPLLACLACWNAAVGAFNPFFNAFFAERLRMSVERIGLVSSISSVFQAVALLGAPAVLTRLGAARGVACMQLATGVMLALLALTQAGGLAGAAFVGYTSAQYMTEPGILSILMGRVRPAERGGASALFFVVTSLAGTLAALAGGAIIPRFGYPFLLMIAALATVASSFLFRAFAGEEAALPAIADRTAEPLLTRE